jgi:paraquat-inducible protein B
MMRKIGLVLLLGFVFLGCKESGLHLKIRYDQVAGLKKGAPLLFEGKRVGEVKNVTYTQEADFIVEVVIEEEFATAATADTEFYITADPRDPGRKAIQLAKLGEAGSALREGTTVRGTTKSLFHWEQLLGTFRRGLKDLQEQFDDLAGEFRKIPDSKEYKRLEKEWERLLKEFKDAEKATREKLENDILPRLREEMEKLREQLRRLKQKQPEAVPT